LYEIPCLCFNKEESLLLVNTNDNGTEILANVVEVGMVCMLESRVFEQIMIAQEMVEMKVCISLPPVY
jgi:hypothetical protein